MLMPALELVEIGFDVVPLIRGSKRPPFPTGRGHANGATRDPDVLKWWFTEEYTNCNIGVVLHLSGHIAVDVDVKHDAPGVESLVALEHDLGLRLTGTTATQLTPTGGWHYIYKVPADVPAAALKTTLAPGLELQKYILVVAPSQTRSGAYRWYRHPRDGVATIPAALLDRARRVDPARQAVRPGRQLAAGEVTPAGVKRLRALADTVARAQAGGRHNLVLWAAAVASEIVVEGHAGEALARGVVVEAARACGEIDEYGEAEVNRWIDDGWQLGRRGAAA
jgi:hypothetical protein